MTCNKTPALAKAETQCLLGAGMEPRVPSPDGAEMLQHIMQQLGSDGLWTLPHVPPGNLHPKFDPNPAAGSPNLNGQVPGTPDGSSNGTGCCFRLVAALHRATQTEVDKPLTVHARRYSTRLPIDERIPNRSTVQ